MPCLLFCHYSAHAGGERIAFNSVFDRPASISVVGHPNVPDDQSAVSQAVAHFAKSAMCGG
jgi:hypothetical protein